MPVFHQYATEVSGRGQTFLEFITGFLDVILREIPGASTINCGPGKDHHFHGNHKDALIIIKGKPYASVCYKTEASDVCNAFGWTPALSCAGVDQPSSVDMRADLAQMAREAFGGEPDTQTEKGLEYRPLRWLMIVRSVAGDERTFEGCPFDFDKIDEAYQHLLTTLISLKKTDSAPAAE